MSDYVPLVAINPVPETDLSSLLLQISPRPGLASVVALLNALLARPHVRAVEAAEETPLALVLQIETSEPGRIPLDLLTLAEPHVESLVPEEGYLRARLAPPPHAGMGQEDSEPDSYDPAYLEQLAQSAEGFGNSLGETLDVLRSALAALSTSVPDLNLPDDAATAQLITDADQSPERVVEHSLAVDTPVADSGHNAPDVHLPPPTEAKSAERDAPASSEADSGPRASSSHTAVPGDSAALRESPTSVAVATAPAGPPDAAPPPISAQGTSQPANGIAPTPERLRGNGWGNVTATTDPAPHAPAVADDERQRSSAAHAGQRLEPEPAQLPGLSGASPGGEAERPALDLAGPDADNPVAVVDADPTVHRPIQGARGRRSGGPLLVIGGLLVAAAAATVLVAALVGRSGSESDSAPAAPPPATQAAPGGQQATPAPASPTPSSAALTPTPIPGSEGAQRYNARAGEAIDGIAYFYGVRIEDLLLINGLPPGTATVPTDRELVIPWW